MTASQYVVAGPISRAVEGCFPAALPGRRRTAAEVLAGMLDLQGSVRLAHCLGGSKPRPATGDASLTASPPLLLGDYVRKRLAAIDDAVSRRLARPFDGARVRVADAPHLFAELASSGATESTEGARAFADVTWRGYRDYFLASLWHARAEVAELREEVTSDLRVSSPLGATLEAVDAAVRGAMSGAVPGLCERLATAMEAPFVGALVTAIRALPAPLEASAIAPWFAERGVLGAQLARTREVTRALLARDARTLETLVDAAYGERIA
jgi:hypothetical protein